MSKNLDIFIAKMIQIVTFSVEKYDANSIFPNAVVNRKN